MVNSYNLIPFVNECQISPKTLLNILFWSGSSFIVTLISWEIKTKKCILLSVKDLQWRYSFCLWRRRSWDFIEIVVKTIPGLKIFSFGIFVLCVSLLISGRKNPSSSFVLWNCSQVSLLPHTTMDIRLRHRPRRLKFCKAE